MARRDPQSPSALAVPAKRQRSNRSPELAPLSDRAGGCRSLSGGEQAPTERESVRRPGKGEGQVPGCGAERSAPLPAFTSGSPVRDANTASSLLQRTRRPGPGRSLSGTRCGPGRLRAGAAPPAPSSPDPQAQRRGRCLRGRAGLEARPRPLPQAPARQGKRDPPAAPGSLPGPGPHEAQAPSQRGRARLGETQDRPFPSRTTAPRARGRNESGARVQHSPGHCPEASAAGAPGRAHGRGAGGCPRPGAEALPARPRNRHHGPGTSWAPPRQPRAPGALRRCLAEPMERPARFPQPSPVRRAGSAAAAGRERCPHTAPLSAAASRSPARRSGGK